MKYDGGLWVKCGVRCAHLGPIKSSIHPPYQLTKTQQPTPKEVVASRGGGVEQSEEGVIKEKKREEEKSDREEDLDKVE